jgi:histidine triad (HIT) family protein
MTCIFCKIVAKEIPATIVYESDTILAFHDVNPKAPVHILVIPKKHLPSLLDFNQTNATLLIDIQQAILNVAVTLKIDDPGFRVVTNVRDHGGQEVNHVHFHVLGGRKMLWPPG